MASSKRILAVDDNDLDRQLLGAFLQIMGHEVILASDGKEALAKLSPSIDLVILDVLMPEMDGYSVTEQIRKRSDCGDVPIIIVTSLSSHEDRLNAVRAGANDFVAKPVDRVELEVRVASLLKMKESVDAVRRYQRELEDMVKKRTVALERSEERFRTVAEVAPFGLAVVSQQEKSEYVNRKFTEIFGYRIEDVPDMGVWFMKSYPDKRYWQKALAAWRDETAEITIEDGLSAESAPRVVPMVCKNGSTKMINFRAAVLADGRLVATFLDVTAEVEAQKEIRRAKEEWERTFHTVADLIVILDNEQRIVRMNRALADRLGIDPEQGVGRRCSEPLNGEDGLGSLCPDSGLLLDGKEFAAEVSDGTLGGVFDLRVSLLKERDGKSFGTVHVARDVTAFKVMEGARKLAVHHLAHELATPLAVISSSVRSLSTNDLSEEARASRMNRIDRNLERLSSIQRVVQEIVDQPDYRPAYLQVEPTLNDILAEIRSKSGHRSVTILSRVAVFETGVIDPKVFSIAVKTLVKNAIENTPDEGEIAVLVEGDADNVLLTVQDWGVGVSSDDQPFIFEAFHHTQLTDHYATKTPFDFNAGGKGLELMRLKVFADSCFFRLSFASRRCCHLPTNSHTCRGRISLCEAVCDLIDCRQTGGTIFSLLFPGHSILTLQ